MQTLVVTYAKHKQELLTQCKTMYRWLEPQPHTIIINEPTMEKCLAWRRWYDRWCAPHLANRSTQILYGPEIIEKHLSTEIRNRDGYIKQQVFKLWFGRVHGEPYLVLDDKNWFTRKVMVAELPRQPRLFDPHLHHTYRNFTRSLERLWKRRIHMVRRIETPYVLDPRVLEGAVEREWNGSWLSMLGWLARQDTPSEFILYDSVAQWQGLEGDPGSIASSTLWNQDDVGKFSMKEFRNRCELFPVIAVHKTWRNRVSFQKLEHHLLYGRFASSE
jgi:hypothetical protein